MELLETPQTPYKAKPEPLAVTALFYTIYDTTVGKNAGLNIEETRPPLSCAWGARFALSIFIYSDLARC